MDIDGGSQPTDRHRPTPEQRESLDGSAPYDLVTVPARQGLEAVDILRRGRGPVLPVAGPGGGVGPVLHNGNCDTLGFLVPPGTADHWNLPGSACTRTSGGGLRLSGTTADEQPLDSTGWLVPPTDAEAVTDPAALQAALDEAARLIEAADRCR